MSQYTFYIPGNQSVQRFIGRSLKAKGFNLATVPCPAVTHLILSVPSFRDDGQLKCGENLHALLQALPEDIIIVGGKLPKDLAERYHTIDLLKDDRYIAQNAYITACCAVRIIMMELPVILRNCSILIIGWGRIAQCLAALLYSMGANVTIASRNSEHRAIACALGYEAVDTNDLTDSLHSYRVICNTAPASIISSLQAEACHEDCLKIDLASKLGIEGKHVLWARGLPGKDAPETSGELIADTVIRLLKKEESS